MHFSKVYGLLALVSSAFAVQNATYCSGGACLVVNIPTATAANGSGDIYFQIYGPTSYSWIGVGQGSRMAGSNMFMIYANSAGTNVTLSTRLGTGDKAPNVDTTASVTLLAGSGIANSVMTANIRCSNCNSWSGGSMSFTDTASKWIWAYKTGSAVSSDSLSVNLAEHSKYGATTLNLVTATGGSSKNPFGTTSAGTASSSSTSSSSSSSSSSGASSGSGTSSDESSSSSSSSEESGPASNFETILLAHAVLGALAFVVFYPLGAIAIRALSFPGLLWVHAGWMIFAYMMALAMMGLGIWIAITTEQLNAYHSIIGLVVVAGLLFQPFTGMIHHILYKRLGRANAATSPHVWWGRAIITLGIINGGLGLQLSENTVKRQLTYGIIAALMWSLWMAAIAFAFFKSRRAAQGDLQREKSENGGERLTGAQSLNQRSGTDSDSGGEQPPHGRQGENGVVYK